MNTDPIYEADGKISVRKAVPFGLQHVLAMFVANIAPILIVTGVVKMPASEAGAVVQAAMIIAGIGSLLQMYPFFRLGSGLPVIMGISFTFVSVFCVIGLKYGYGAILGAVLIGGVLEGILGLGAAWWRKLVPPIVSATVVTAIGFSLLPSGANSFGGGFGHPAIGFVSAASSLFGCLPITSFSQNVGLIAMTHVVNRKAIASGAVIMVLAGLIPALGVILASLPEAVLGGCTLMMFGSIVVSGVQMISRCGYSQRNMSIAALSLSIGLGFTQTPQIFRIFPELLRSVFAENCVAVVFIVAVLLNLVFPKGEEEKAAAGAAE